MMRVHTRKAGASLVEFALVLPLLLLLIIGGSCLFVRNLYRNALDAAAEQAAWAAARTGGDVMAVQDAVQRAIPFVPLADLAVSATSTGYHAEVAVTVSYQGAAITSLPFFNTPLAEAQASATNQQERAFTLHLGAGTPGGSPSPTSSAPRVATEASPRVRGPAAWPAGPAALPGGH
jgi:Flp pilus assembly protein TadG